LRQCQVWCTEEHIEQRHRDAHNAEADDGVEPGSGSNDYDRGDAGQSGQYDLGVARRIGPVNGQIRRPVGQVDGISQDSDCCKQNDAGLRSESAFLHDACRQLSQVVDAVDDLVEDEHAGKLLRRAREERTQLIAPVENGDAGRDGCEAGHQHGREAVPKLEVRLQGEAADGRGGRGEEAPVY